MIMGVTSAVGAQRPVTARAASAGKTADFSEALKNASSVLSGQGTSLSGIFEKAAETYNVPVNLLEAVAKAESGFRADAVSSCGAQGIMQLMPSTAASLGVTNSFDPEQNIMGGAKYLGQLLASFHGDASLAVAGYNAGGGAVLKYGGIPPYAETQSYVKKVLGYAGMDLSVPETAYTASGKTSSALLNEGTEETGDAPSDMLLSAHEFLGLAQMYVQRMEQSVLEEITDRSAGNGTTAL